MLFDFSRFLQSLESRARRLSGYAAGSYTLAAIAGIALAAMLVVRLLRMPLPLWGLGILLLLPLTAGLVGYAVGRSSRPRIPSVLLRVDDTLRLNARLSSLYELRQRGGASVFRDRIEAEVTGAVSEWRTALPVAKRTILRGSAGACCIALAVGLAFVPIPQAAQSPLDLVESSAALSQETLPFDQHSIGAPTTGDTAPSTIRTAAEGDQGAGTATFDTPDRDETLEDVMRDLSGMSPDDAVLVPVSPEDIEEIAKLQSEAVRAVAKLLDDIRDRLREDSPPSDMTEEELEALQRELDRGGIPPDLEEGLNELMNAPQPRSIEEIVEQLLDQFGDEDEGAGDTSEEGRSGPPQSTAVAPDQQGIEELLEELGQASQDAGQEPESGAPADAGGPPADPDSDGEAPPGDRLGVGGEDGVENPDQFGGSEGSTGLLGEQEEQEAGFIREEEQAKIGSEGNFVSEFITEGVPIEWPASPDGEEPSFRVDYERIASVLRERGLPEGAIDIVRHYFNAITEGGS
jgi:hypothetical protein